MLQGCGYFYGDGRVHLNTLFTIFYIFH
jgi:hypothetical protein